jgi:hypothetical protein
MLRCVEVGFTCAEADDIAAFGAQAFDEPEHRAGRRWPDTSQPRRN